MIGRYQVLKPLAKGGMAEVLLGRTIGLGGFERYVVIKRIRVENTNDQKAIDMFLDEARLVASLHHRNIVQVHDVGEESGKYFFVMEYVHGRDTRELLRHVKEQKQQVPLEHVITIVSTAATGLHHAHEQRGADRKPLGIVHRDISPGNILLGFDGGVKVVDFGIAKAEKRKIDTAAGELKGKLGYMAPEQCEGEPVDRRTDVYLLGIVLWELCTVRRLFNRETRYDTMTAIVDGDIPPPSKYRKDLPADLEQIVMKSLARKPDDRFQTADELRLALEAYATRAGLPVSPARLADYLKEQFGNVPEPWLVDEPVPEPTVLIRDSYPVVPVPQVDPTLAASPATDTAAADQEKQNPAEELPTDAPDELARITRPALDQPVSWPVDPASERRRRAQLIVITIVLAVGAVGYAAFRLSTYDWTSGSAENAAAPPSDVEPVTPAAAAPIDAAVRDAVPDAAIDAAMPSTAVVPDAGVPERAPPRRRRAARVKHKPDAGVVEAEPSAPE